MNTKIRTPNTIDNEGVANGRSDGVEREPVRPMGTAHGVLDLFYFAAVTSSGLASNDVILSFRYGTILRHGWQHQDLSRQALTYRPSPSLCPMRRCRVLDGFVPTRFAAFAGNCLSPGRLTASKQCLSPTSSVIVSKDKLFAANDGSNRVNE